VSLVVSKMLSVIAITTLAAFAGHAQALSDCVPRGSNYTNSASSLTLLYQNNLNLTDDVNHIGAILLDPMPASKAAAGCSVVSESLLTQAAIEAHTSDFYYTLSYLSFSKRAPANGQYLIANGTTVSQSSIQGQVTFQSASTASDAQFPVLCTQSDKVNTPDTTVTATNQIRVGAAGNTYIGLRNQKSFRFNGIRFAPQPNRWEYSVPYAAKGQVLNATQYGPQCVQVGSGGSEDCLFLNIQTPYLPKAGSVQGLRPVLFWIHGGVCFSRGS
jgi:hypothetical protein